LEIVRTPQPGEHVGRHQTPGDGIDVLVGDDPRPEAVPDRRAHGLDLPLLAVQGHGEELLVLHPEALVEALLEIARSCRRSAS
jgi:hypothetical protein